MYKNITPDYYGYRDDDDGILMAKEIIQEVSERAILISLSFFFNVWFFTLLFLDYISVMFLTLLG